MKKAFELFSATFFLFLVIAIFISCDDNEVKPTPVSKPVIESFTPGEGRTPAQNTGLPGETVIITGLNFNPTPAMNEVRFNNTLATITEASATQLTATVPQGATSGKISVTTNSNTATSATDFIITLQNVWIQKAEFPGAVRTDAVNFSIGNKLYVGLGNSGTTLLTDLWEYNSETNHWLQRKDFPAAARFKAIGMAIGTKGYVGTGMTAGGSLVKDFWEYDPATNEWTQKTDYPTVRYSAYGFAIGAKGYVGGGATNAPALDHKDFWEYNPQTNEWIQKQDMPFQRYSYNCNTFVIGSSGYICGGASIGNGSLKDLYEYNPTTDEWTKKADFPYGVAGSPMTSCLSIGSKGFAGRQTEFAMYDPAQNQWTEKANLPISVIQGIGISVASGGYAGIGMVAADRTKAFYKYTPD